MKHSSTIKVSFVALAFVALSIIAGCSKEPASNPRSVTNANALPVDSSYYLKGIFGTQPLTIEGNAVYYSLIDTTITPSHPGGSCHDSDGDHDGQNNNNGDPDNDQANPVFVTGTKWVIVHSSGGQTTQTSVASVELRSLDVRIFVTPIAQSQSQFFDMLAPTANYGLATVNNPQQGAYVTILDQNGVRWTSIGDQTGSSFAITTRGAMGTLSAPFSGTFSIKVYDGNGNVKQLSNVTFSAIAGL